MFTRRHIIRQQRSVSTGCVGKLYRPLGKYGVGQTRDVLLALLDNNEGENGNVGSDDAAANRLPLALASNTGAEARVAC
jgi:hypothetical protein